MPDEESQQAQSAPTEMNPHLIGRGGNHGAYVGLSVAEVEQVFRKCEVDPSMRSVTAILRMTREQCRSRGQLGVYPRMALGMSLVGAGLLVAYFYVPEGLQKTAAIGGMGFFVMGLLLTYGAVTGAKERQASVAQEQAIMRLACESLDRLLPRSFPRKPLLREHVDTLRDLVKARPDLATLRELLAEN